MRGDRRRRGRRRSLSRSLSRSRSRSRDRSGASASSSGRSRSRRRSRSRSRSPGRRRRRGAALDERLPRRRSRSRSPREARGATGSFGKQREDMSSAQEREAAPPPAPAHEGGGHGRRRDRPRGKGKSRGGRGGKGPKISIPKNWTDVPKMGAVVGTSRFVAIRVPLDDKYARFFEQDSGEMWSPKLFLEQQAEQELNVRLVIDLTNTFKYYDGAAEFQDSTIEYAKLKIEGFKAPPRESEVDKFIAIVDEFLAKEPSGNIAVHCTHGLNRTGYLVVNYLVRRLNYTVTDALAAFLLARPPGLIKHMYVEDLYRRLGQEGEQVELPTLPDWAEEKYSKRSFHH